MEIPKSRSEQNGARVDGLDESECMDMEKTPSRKENKLEGYGVEKRKGDRSLMVERSFVIWKVEGSSPFDRPFKEERN